MSEIMSKSNFINYIKSKISADKYERERYFRLLTLVMGEIVCICLLFFCINSLIKTFNNPDDLIGLFLIVITSFIIIILITIFLLPYIANKNFKKYLKKASQNAIYDALNVKISDNKFFSAVKLKKTNLFAVFNEVKYDDSLVGTYKGVNFTVDEIDLKERVNNKNVEQVFKGVIISYDTNKKFFADTLITSKDDIKIANNRSIARTEIQSMLFLILIMTFIIFILELLEFFFFETSNFNILNIFAKIPNLMIMYLMFFGILIYWSIKYFQKRKFLKNIKTEDIDFDRMFNVYSQHQVEGRYLVTPTFMERMKNLQTAFGTKNLKCSFTEGRVIFAISTTKDLFEIGSLYGTFERDLEKFYDEIKSIYDMIDYFKLDEKTGL